MPAECPGIAAAGFLLGSANNIKMVIGNKKPSKTQPTTDRPLLLAITPPRIIATTTTTT